MQLILTIALILLSFELGILKKLTFENKYLLPVIEYDSYRKLFDKVDA